MLAYDLLVTESVDEAARLSATLNEINIERQQLLGRQVERARELLGDDDGCGMLIIDDPEFHEGIVGLVASRLADEFYRPCLVMRRGQVATKGRLRRMIRLILPRQSEQHLERLVGDARVTGAAAKSRPFGRET